MFMHVLLSFSIGKANKESLAQEIEDAGGNPTPSYQDSISFSPRLGCRHFRLSLFGSLQTFFLSAFSNDERQPDLGLHLRQTP